MLTIVAAEVLLQASYQQSAGAISTMMTAMFIGPAADGYVYVRLEAAS